MPKRFYVHSVGEWPFAKGYGEAFGGLSANEQSHNRLIKPPNDMRRYQDGKVAPGKIEPDLRGNKVILKRDGGDLARCASVIIGRKANRSSHLGKQSIQQLLLDILWNPKIQSSSQGIPVRN